MSAVIEDSLWSPWCIIPHSFLPHGFHPYKLETEMRLELKRAGVGGGGWKDCQKKEE